MEYEIDSDEAVSIAVVFAVSSFENRRVNSLPALNESIDPDALDRLFESKRSGTIGQSGSVSFAFSNSQVTVNDDEQIQVESIA